MCIYVSDVYSDFFTFKLRQALNKQTTEYHLEFDGITRMAWNLGNFNLFNIFNFGKFKYGLKDSGKNVLKLLKVKKKIQGLKRTENRTSINKTFGEYRVYYDHFSCARKAMGIFYVIIEHDLRDVHWNQNC